MTNAEKVKRYRERNPDKFRQSLYQYWKKPFECACGTTTTMKNKQLHLKSKRHIFMLEHQELLNKVKKLENNENKEDSETSSEEDEFINNYLSKGKYDKEGLVITTDSDTD